MTTRHRRSPSAGPDAATRGAQVTGSDFSRSRNWAAACGSVSRPASRSSTAFLDAVSLQVELPTTFQLFVGRGILVEKALGDGRRIGMRVSARARVRAEVEEARRAPDEQSGNRQWT
ncbi:MAG TPA: hypothetical protein VKD72_21535 [Gemmataceae bacterium]|nr:hypothetical protein [Gemmataceae bacterium]